MSLGGGIGFGLSQAGVDPFGQRGRQQDRSLDIRERLAGETVKRGEYQRGSFESQFEQLMAERDDAMRRGDMDRVNRYNDWIMKQMMTRQWRKGDVEEDRAYREQQAETKSQRRKAERAIDYSRERRLMEHEADLRSERTPRRPTIGEMGEEDFARTLDRTRQLEAAKYGGREESYRIRDERKAKQAEELATIKFQMRTGNKKAAWKWTPQEKAQLRIFERAANSRLKLYNDTYGNDPSGWSPTMYDEEYNKFLDRMVENKMRREKIQGAEDTSPFTVPGGEEGVAPPEGARQPVPGSRTPPAGARTSVQIAQPPVSSQDLGPGYTYTDINQILGGGKPEVEDVALAANSFLDTYRKPNGRAQVLAMALRNRAASNLEIAEAIKLIAGAPGGPTVAESEDLDSILSDAPAAAYREGIQMGKYVQDPESYGYAFFDAGVASDQDVGPYLPGGIFALNAFVLDQIERGQIPAEPMMQAGRSEMEISIFGREDLPGMELDKEKLAQFGQDGTPENGQMMLGFLRELHAIYSPRVKHIRPSYDENPATARMETEAVDTNVLGEMLPSARDDSSALVGMIRQSAMMQDGRYARLIDLAGRFGVGTTLMNETQMAMASKMKMGGLPPEGQGVAPTNLDEAFMQQGQAARVDETQRLLNEAIAGAGQ